MEYKIADMHNDFFTSKTCDSLKLGAELTNFAVWSTYLKEDETFKLIEKIPQNSKTLLSVEDCSNISNYDRKIIDYIDIFSLTWNFDNVLGGGALGNNIGLTDKGLQVLQKLNERKKIIDVAHCSCKTFYDIAENADKIIDTHTCIYELCEHPRNLTYEQLKIILEKGGIVGITLVGDFLTKKPKAVAEDVARHIDFFVQKFGNKAVGIGSDFFGTENLPVDVDNYEKYSIIVEKLLNMGYNSLAVEGILYKNFTDFLEKNAL